MNGVCLVPPIPMSTNTPTPPWLLQKQGFSQSKSCFWMITSTPPGENIITPTTAFFANSTAERINSDSPNQWIAPRPAETPGAPVDALHASGNYTFSTTFFYVPLPSNLGTAFDSKCLYLPLSYAADDYLSAIWLNEKLVYSCLGRCVRLTYMQPILLTNITIAGNFRSFANNTLEFQVTTKPTLASSAATTTPTGLFVQFDGTVQGCNCPAGYYNIGGSGCLPCPVNTYSTGGASSCLPCPEGTHSTNSGSDCSSNGSDRTAVPVVAPTTQPQPAPVTMMPFSVPVPQPTTTTTTRQPSSTTATLTSLPTRHPFHTELSGQPTQQPITSQQPSQQQQQQQPSLQPSQRLIVTEPPQQQPPQQQSSQQPSQQPITTTEKPSKQPSQQPIVTEPPLQQQPSRQPITITTMAPTTTTSRSQTTTITRSPTTTITTTVPTTVPSKDGAKAENDGSSSSSLNIDAIAAIAAVGLLLLLLSAFFVTYRCLQSKKKQSEQSLARWMETDKDNLVSIYKQPNNNNNNRKIGSLQIHQVYNHFLHHSSHGATTTTENPYFEEGQQQQQQQRQNPANLTYKQLQAEQRRQEEERKKLVNNNNNNNNEEEEEGESVPRFQSRLQASLDSDSDDFFNNNNNNNNHFVSGGEMI